MRAKPEDVAGRRTTLIFNPSSGRKRAARRSAGIRNRWREHAEISPTERPGHAEELAIHAVTAGADMIIAAGGDGTVHEVANGLLRTGRLDVTLGVLPTGSANDYAWSLHREFGDTATQPQLVDVGYVHTSSGQGRYFVCCLGAGLNGMVTHESRQIECLRGLALYGLAAFRALRSSRKPPRWEIDIDSRQQLRGPSRMLSVMLGQREGSFRMAPEAKLGDGQFDFVHAGPLSRAQTLRMLPRLAFSGPPTAHPQVRRGRCRQLRLVSDQPICAHVDGELLCVPEDQVRWLEIELLPARLKVQLCPMN